MNSVSNLLPAFPLPVQVLVNEILGERFFYLVLNCIEAFFPLLSGVAKEVKLSYGRLGGKRRGRNESEEFCKCYKIIEIKNLIWKARRHYFKDSKRQITQTSVTDYGEIMLLHLVIRLNSRDCILLILLKPSNN